MKEDTKWRLRDIEGKEYIIIDSEKVDMQEELNKMITKQMKEIERLNNIINVFDGGISYKTAMKMLKIAKKELIKQKIRTWWKIS